jgi:hypothetical protein
MLVVLKVILCVGGVEKWGRGGGGPYVGSGASSRPPCL